MIICDQTEKKAKSVSQLGAWLHELDEILEEDVTILLAEAVDVVLDIARIVFDQEACWVAREMWMRAEGDAQLLQQLIVHAVAWRVHRLDNVVRYAEYARRRAPTLDQVAHNFVVEKVYVGPFDAFLLVFLLQINNWQLFADTDTNQILNVYLFCLECELDEDLLQLLVDIVYAELFKAVLIEYFKPKIAKLSINLKRELFLQHPFQTRICQVCLYSTFYHC